MIQLLLLVTKFTAVGTIFEGFTMKKELHKACARSLILVQAAMMMISDQASQREMRE